MADVIRTVGSGGNETTIGAALTWMKNGANYTMGTHDLGIIRIIDSAEYLITTALDFSGFTGTPSATSHPVLEADSSNRHDGTYNTSKARIRNATAGVHCLTIGQDYTHIKYMSIMQDSTGDSDECIRMLTGVTDVIVEKCVLYLNNDTTSQDAIYAGEYAVGPITIFDCVIRCGGQNSRGAINAQKWTGGTATQTWHIEHNTIDNNDAKEGGSARATGIIGWAEGPSDIVNFYVYNTISVDSDVAAYDYRTYDAGAQLGTVNFVGQGNMGSDTTCQTELGATNNFDSQTMSITDEAATEILVTSLTAGSENYQLIEGASSTNNAVGGAIEGAVAAGRDTRVTLGFDIAGNARPATYTDRDIGAFEVESAGSVNTRTLKSQIQATDGSPIG